MGGWVRVRWVRTVRTRVEYINWTLAIVYIIQRCQTPGSARWCGGRVQGWFIEPTRWWRTGPATYAKLNHIRIYVYVYTAYVYACMCVCKIEQKVHDVGSSWCVAITTAHDHPTQTPHHINTHICGFSMRCVPLVCVCVHEGETLNLNLYATPWTATTHTHTKLP